MDNIILKYMIKESKDDDIQEKIFNFFLKNPKPKDKQIHSFAEDLNIEHSKFEEIVYNMLGSFLSGGKSIKFTGDYDTDQIKKGMKYEMEHTSSPFMAKKITLDHLAEIPDYYDRLEKMEKEYKNTN
jgi:hypothetical protein